MSKKPPTTDALYARGRRYHEEGALAKAKDCYLEVLRKEPEHADALHAIGNLDARAGALQDAERVIRKAIALAPDRAGFYISLGNVLRAGGRRTEAAAAYEAELQRRPDFGIAHQQLGVLALEQGESGAAVEHLLKAVRYAPNLPDAHYHLGIALARVNRLDDAGSALLEALRLRPEFAAACHELGRTLRAMGRLEKAADCLASAVGMDPDLLEAHYDLGVCNLQLRRPARAAAAFYRVLKRAPRHAGAHHQLGVLHHDLGLLDEAIEQYREALRVTDGRRLVRGDLGAALLSCGRIDEAAEEFAELCEIHPDDGAGLAGLADVYALRGHDEEGIARLHASLDSGMRDQRFLSSFAALLAGDGRHAQAIDMLEASLQQPPQPALRDEASVRFRLGELYDLRGNHERAWNHFSAANALRSGAFDRSAWEKQVAAALTDSDAAVAAAPADGQDQRPVFIVGMPRSGCALVEQILAAHPQVVGGGELNLLLRARRSLAARQGQSGAQDQAPAVDWARHAQAVSARLDRLAPGALRITDRLWQNVEQLELLAALLPGARVIHCSRDPVETAMSCYFHNSFHTVPVPFSYDVADIGAWYQGYRQLLARWLKAPGIATLTVNYESLVENPEKVVRELIAFCGIEWDERCLRHQESGRLPVAPGHRRLRGPLDKTSLHRSRQYEQYLGPLREAIGPNEGNA